MSQRFEGETKTGAATHRAPRSVYVHIPFCRHRCGYCNFALVANRDYLVDRFLQAIEWELSQVPEPLELDTLYLGGGTPTHLNDRQLARLFESLTKAFSRTADCEVTIEANPSDLLRDRAALFREWGVNRVSLGVQSFQASKLRRLDRDHHPDEARRAIEQARDFARSVSLDLIFAAPDETLMDWQADLERLAEAGVDHVSTYELTYEKGTRFWTERHKGNQAEAEEDLRLNMYRLAIDRLTDMGFRQYEISSFAKPGRRSRHNSVYWTGDPFWAFGPGACGYIDSRRYQNVPSTTQYLKLVERGERPIADSEELSPPDRARELLAIGLRQIEGVSIGAFQARTGTTPRECAPQALRQLVDWSLLQLDDDRLRLTRKGVELYDTVAAEIVNEVPEADDPTNPPTAREKPPGAPIGG